MAQISEHKLLVKTVLIIYLEIHNTNLIINRNDNDIKCSLLINSHKLDKLFINKYNL